MSNTPAKPPQTTMILRVLVSGYLLYLAWDIRGSFSEGPIFIIAAVVFALVGGAVLWHSLRTLITHEYFKKDPVRETESTEDWEESSDE